MDTLRWLLAVCFLSVGRTKILFSNNGYENVVIAVSIGDSAKPHKLISKIKAEISAFSTALLEATHGWASIRSVRIVIPSNWDTFGTKSETCLSVDDADIEVYDDRTRSPFGISVEQLFGCGAAGSRISIDQSFFGQNSRLSGKKLLQKWAQFRYGVFDESVPSPSSEKEMMSSLYRKYYPLKINSTVKWKPSVCSTHVQSTEALPAGGFCLTNSHWLQYQCDVQLGKEQNATASIMFTTDITHFCSDDDNERNEKHNIYAMNRHNHMCNFRSVWAVILQNKDFVGYR
ncbi:unnamed protein product [Soboliphyme baturini]|uniref:CLCA domain-containing protein n=1 Tax=Soboliphyme baturini TaxID=241478 RepID=A0A183J201_9BILA|nr:unnamed protein product [Soboliphyme baturini]